MKYKPVFTSPLTISVIGVIYVALVAQCWAQTDTKKPPAFGSSLKRPKVTTTDRLNENAKNELSEEIIRGSTEHLDLERRRLAVRCVRSETTCNLQSTLSSRRRRTECCKFVLEIDA